MKSEELARLRVENLGVQKARARLDEIAALGQARFDAAHEGVHPGCVPSGYTCLNYLSNAERQEMHELQIGLSLTENPVAEAKARIHARVKACRDRRTTHQAA